MAISNNSTGLRPGVCTSTTRPTAPYEGQMIYETDTDLTYVWGGSAWQQVSGGTAVGNSGLVYVGNTAIPASPASSTITLSNVFSATYNNYRINISGVDNDRDAEGIRVTLQGVSGTLYKNNVQFQTWGVGTFAASGGTAQSQFLVGFAGLESNSNVSFDLFNPFNAIPTTFFGMSSSTSYFFIGGGLCTSTVQSTGFTVTIDSSTFTGGNITVYGYRKA